jgi:hypothetical protein
MEVDDIISYHDVVTAEKAALQKGMNYGVGKNYSVFLMSLRENAPYADALDPVTGMLIRRLPGKVTTSRNGEMDRIRSKLISLPRCNLGRDRPLATPNPDRRSYREKLDHKPLTMGECRLIRCEHVGIELARVARQISGFASLQGTRRTVYNDPLF